MPPRAPTASCGSRGLRWPGERGLDGHSDADVAAHAACDAIFSAAGIGDLGAHFGTSRPELAGASGVTLLAEAARLVREAGYEIGNIAVQVIGNRPKVGSRRAEAEAALSAGGRRARVGERHDDRRARSDGPRRGRRCHRHRPRHRPTRGVLTWPPEGSLTGLPERLVGRRDGYVITWSGEASPVGLTRRTAWRPAPSSRSSLP